MKLSWSTKNGRRWEADFGNGYLTLVIDYDHDKFGIYDPFCGGAPVWEQDDTTGPWEDLAEIAEQELTDRLHETASTLDASGLEAKQKHCDVCHFTGELHQGYYEGDQRRCLPCLKDFNFKVVREYMVPLVGDYSGLQAITEDKSRFTSVSSDQAPIMYKPGFTMWPKYPISPQLERGTDFKIEPVDVSAIDAAALKATENVVNHYYTHFVESSEIYRFDEPPSTQVADMIKAEAAGICLENRRSFQEEKP